MSSHVSGASGRYVERGAEATHTKTGTDPRVRGRRVGNVPKLMGLPEECAVGLASAVKWEGMAVFGEVLGDVEGQLERGGEAPL